MWELYKDFLSYLIAYLHSNTVNVKVIIWRFAFTSFHYIVLFSTHFGYFTNIFLRSFLISSSIVSLYIFEAISMDLTFVERTHFRYRGITLILDSLYNLIYRSEALQ